MRDQCFTAHPGVSSALRAGARASGGIGGIGIGADILVRRLPHTGAGVPRLRSGADLLCRGLRARASAPAPARGGPALPGQRAGACGPCAALAPVPGALPGRDASGFPPGARHRPTSHRGGAESTAGRPRAHRACSATAALLLVRGLVRATRAAGVSESAPA